MPVLRSNFMVNTALNMPAAIMQTFCYIRFTLSGFIDSSDRNIFRKLSTWTLSVSFAALTLILILSETSITFSSCMHSPVPSPPAVFFTSLLPHSPFFHPSCSFPSPLPPSPVSSPQTQLESLGVYKHCWRLWTEPGRRTHCSMFDTISGANLCSVNLC